MQLLLLLLSSLVTEGCETGVAFVDSVLSVPRSLMANADVALLKSYDSTTLGRCMEDCCSGKYGSCSVASFKKNTTKENCLHFYCRPLNKCKFLSSNSTDSFSFSSNPIAVPSSSTLSTSTSSSTTARSSTVSGSSSTAASKTAFGFPTTLAKKDDQQQPKTKEEIATYSEEQFAPKNDNTTIKPRKGVDDPDALLSKSSIKPRKGVSVEDISQSQFLLNSLNKSNVKPRKGVEPFATVLIPTPYPTVALPEAHSSSPSLRMDVSSVLLATSAEDIASNELMSALEKVFEDDPHTESTSYTSRSVIISTTPTRSYNYATVELLPSQSHTKLFPSYNVASNVVQSSTPTIQTLSRQYVSEAVEERIATVSSSVLPISTTHQQRSNPQSLPGHEPFDKLVAEETENDRRYKSSIHLVLSLVFGLLVLFAVLGVVAKRVYDGWLRRDYYRMNYLIDGIYNGVE